MLVKIFAGVALLLAATTLATDRGTAASVGDTIADTSGLTAGIMAGSIPDVLDNFKAGKNAAEKQDGKNR